LLRSPKAMKQKKKACYACMPSVARQQLHFCSASPEAMPCFCFFATRASPSLLR
jgi:hypothetical protein